MRPVTSRRRGVRVPTRWRSLRRPRRASCCWSAALLSAGAFVGNWGHNETVGDAWVQQVVACEQLAAEQVAALPADQVALERVAVFQQCMAADERWRVAFSMGGVAVAAAVGLAVLVAVPHVLERRRGLQRLGANLRPAEERFAALAAAEGLARVAMPMVGQVKQVRDAFSYGLPGRYRVMLPKVVAVRSVSGGRWSSVWRWGWPPG